MTALGPARTLKEAYRFCDPMRPLNDPEWQAAFYVERSPDSRIDTLQASLELDDAEDDKTLFDYHRERVARALRRAGCG